MAIRFNSATANAMLSGGLREAMQGGVVELRSGTAPSAASDSATGTLLCSIPIPSDGFSSPSAAEMSVSSTWTGVVAEGGEVGWARMVGSGGTGRIDFTSVTGEGGGGDLEISNNIDGVDDTTLVADGSANIVSGTVSVPGTS